MAWERGPGCKCHCNHHWEEEERPGGGRWVKADPMQMMVVFWKQVRARTGPKELSFILLFLCKTQCQSLRHPQETSEPVLLCFPQRGSGLAHVPTGDEAHQGTGVHRLQGTPCPQDRSPFFQPAAGQRPHSPILIPPREPRSSPVYRWTTQTSCSYRWTFWRTLCLGYCK